MGDIKECCAEKWLNPAGNPHCREGNDGSLLAIAAWHLGQCPTVLVVPALSISSMDGARRQPACPR